MIKNGNVLPFTVEEVVEAVNFAREKGFEIIRGNFIRKNSEGKICGLCAISSVLVYRGKDLENKSFSDRYFDYFDRYFDYFDSYNEENMWAFIKGFDSDDDDATDQCFIYDGEEASFLMGVESRRRIFGEDE